MVINQKYKTIEAYQFPLVARIQQEANEAYIVINLSKIKNLKSTRNVFLRQLLGIYLQNRKLLYSKTKASNTI